MQAWKIIVISMVLLCVGVGVSYAGTVVFGPYVKKGREEAAIKHYFGRAKQKIHISAVSLTNEEIIKTLIACHKRGVKIRIILDKFQAGKDGNKEKKLIDIGVPIHYCNKHRFHTHIAMIDGGPVLRNISLFLSGYRDKLTPRLSMTEWWSGTRGQLKEFNLHLALTKEYDVKSLLKKLKEPDEEKRMAIISLLSEERKWKKETVPALMDIVKNGKDLSYRTKAVNALSKLKSNEAIPVLIHTFEKDTSRCRRKAIVFALGDMKAKEAVPVFINELKNGKDDDVRDSVARTLGDMQVKVVVPELIKLLKKGPVRSSAAYALGRLLAKAAIPELIIALRKKQEWYVRCSVINALGALNVKKIIPELIEIFKNDKNNYVKRAAIRALGLLRAKDAEPVLIEAFKKTKDSFIRDDILYALGIMKSKRSILLLKKEMEDELFLSEGVIQALGIMKIKGAIPKIVYSLYNASFSDGRSAAAFALGEMQAKEAIPHLIRRLTCDKSENVRCQIIGSLYKMKYKKAIPIFIEVLEQDPSWIVHKKAHYVLKKLTDKSFGKDQAKWQKWWNENKDKVLKGEGKERVKKNGQEFLKMIPDRNIN